jgi:L,D-peptidoglycan transpeptidase YkuD (ErfK/YbiS/YcfS/YnhG family)
LKRADELYDLLLVLGYNDRPRVKEGKRHLRASCAAGFTPTDGCIALTRHDFTMLLAEVRRGTQIVILR